MRSLWIFAIGLLSVFNLSSGFHKKGKLGKLFHGRSRMTSRPNRDEFKSQVCFDLVGCFADPPPRLSFKRPPEHPSIIQTRFLLYTRENRMTGKPETLFYDDLPKSIAKSSFGLSKSLKIIIHGFKGSGSDVGGILATNLLLDMEDTNVIILDWTKGAGTSYQAAVANTELVGRQLALVLLYVVDLGVKPLEIHMIGFSLGAHVAGCASEVLKSKKLLLGRITGLDPASPLFRNNVLREKSRKLDISDAHLVDVIHTDGSEVFTDGFGLLKPIGHIDFFPNGGMEQPGCSDIKNSIVYSHFHEDILDREIACSHIRAWELFLASVQSQQQECKFTAWPCTQGVGSFARGTCFPHNNTKWIQEMGYTADRGPLGVYYLATRPAHPFCGDPLRAEVITSKAAQRTAGIFFLRIEHGNTSTVFKIPCDLNDRIERPLTFFNIAAATFRSITENTKIIKGYIWYQPIIEEQEEVSTRRPRSPTLLFDKLAIEDRKGNRWEYCREKSWIDFNETPVEFQTGFCRIVHAE